MVARNAMFPFLSLLILTTVAINSIATLRVDSLRLDLEGRYCEAAPEFDIGGFVIGDLQKQAESFLSDRIPERGGFLILNATMERSVIQIANGFFSYDTIPTAFDSNRFYCKENNRLLNMPRKATIGQAVRCAIRAELFNHIFMNHKQINTYIFAVPTSTELADSPVARKLRTPQATYSFYKQYFFNKIRGASLIDSWVSYDEFCEGWFKGDHHWNIIGAYNGYVKAASAMGFPKSVVKPRKHRFYEQPLFWRSLARGTRCIDVSDNIMDYEFDIDSAFLDIIYDGEPSTLESLVHTDKYSKGSWSNSPFRDRYGEYFHGDPGEIVIRNNHATETNRTLLLVSNSYSNCIERLFAKHYGTVLVYDARHNSQSLSEYLNAHPDVDDMLLLLNLPGFIR